MPTGTSLAFSDQDDIWLPDKLSMPCPRPTGCATHWSEHRIGQYDPAELTRGAAEVGTVVVHRLVALRDRHRGRGAGSRMTTCHRCFIVSTGLPHMQPDQHCVPDRLGTPAHAAEPWEDFAKLHDAGLWAFSSASRGCGYTVRATPVPSHCGFRPCWGGVAATRSRTPLGTSIGLTANVWCTLS